MRIAFIGQKGIPAYSGGVEKHVEHVAVRLAQEGHDVFVYVRSHYTDPAVLAHKGVRLIHAPSWHCKNFEAITHTFFSTVHALFQGYDIVHYQSVGPTSLSFIPKILLRKTKVVATFHCQDQFHKKWGWFAKMYLRFGEFITCKVPDATIVVSRSLRKFALKTYARKTVLIPNGADIHMNVASDRLANFGLEPGKYVLSVGRLVKHKGVHYLLKSFLHLQKTGAVSKDMFLVVVGSHAQTPKYEAKLKAMAAGNDRILFLGEQTGENLAQLFANAAVFVQPSESEGLSIALLEAMGYGLPIVASDIDANVEAVADTGLFFHDRDVTDLSKQLAFALSHPKKMKAFGSRAMERIENHFSWKAIAEKTLALYRLLLQS